jgi:hypothetical protein
MKLEDLFIYHSILLYFYLKVRTVVGTKDSDIIIGYTITNGEWKSILSYGLLTDDYNSEFNDKIQNILMLLIISTTERMASISR